MIKRRHFYRGLVQTVDTANITSCSSSNGTSATKPCDYACVEIKVQARRSSITSYYKDCSEGLLKRAPCKECWPNATRADYSFVTTNVTIFDYDKRGDLWTFWFCAADNCTAVFRSKDTTPETPSVFTFVGIALDVLLVLILVRAVYLKINGNRAPSGSSRFGPVTFEVTNNPTSSSTSDSEAMLHYGDRLKSYFSSSTSESGTMLTHGRQPLSGPSDTPQMREFYGVGEAAMPITLPIMPSIPLNPPPSAFARDDSSSEDKTQWHHSSSCETVTNVSGNSVDENRNSEVAASAADQEQTPSVTSSVSHSDTSALQADQEQTPSVTSSVSYSDTPKHIPTR